MQIIETNPYNIAITLSLNNFLEMKNTITTLEKQNHDLLD